MNENYETVRELRRRLTRIGWGFLLYLAVMEVLSFAAVFIPGEVPSTLVSYFLLYVVSPVFFWLVVHKLPKGHCRNTSLSVRALVRTAVVSVGTLELFAYVTNFAMILFENVSGQTTTDVLQTATSSMPTWLYLVLVGVLAPLGEEFMFRRLLLDRVRPFGDHAAIWITAVAFGLFHMNLYQFFYATALGVLFAGVVVKTGKLWHSVVLHSAVNLLSALLSSVSLLSDFATIAVLVVVIALMIYAVWAIFHFSKSYSCDPPQYPATNQQVAMAAVRSVGLWVCTAAAMIGSVAIIFIAY